MAPRMWTPRQSRELRNNNRMLGLVRVWLQEQLDAELYDLEQLLALPDTPDFGWRAAQVDDRQRTIAVLRDLLNRARGTTHHHQVESDGVPPQ